MSSAFSPQLIELINSLNQAEKRYFKRFANRHSPKKDSIYLQLFDLINRKKIHDEYKLCQKLQLKDTNSLSFHKHHLYQLILRSLRAYHHERTLDIQLASLLIDVENLYRKSLFSHCRDLLKKAAKLATEHQKTLFLLQILEWKKQLLYVQENVDKMEEEIPHIQAEEARQIRLFQNLTEYWLLYFRFSILIRRNTVIRDNKMMEAVEELAHLPEFQEIEHAFSTDALVLLHYSRSLYQFMKGDTEQFYQENLALVEEMEKLPQRIQDRPAMYISILGHLVSNCIIQNRYDEALDWLDRLKAIEPDAPHNQKKIFFKYYSNKFLIFLQTSEFQEGVKLAEEMQAGPYALDQGPYKLTYFYYFFYCYFGAGNYSAALHWINELLNEKPKGKRQDLQSVARMVNLIIHYELGNMILLENITHSTQRYLKTRGRLFEMERSLLKLFRKLSKVVEGEEQAIFEESYEEMHRIASLAGERSLFNYFDFLSWLKSKMGEMTFEQIRKQKRV